MDIDSLKYIFERPNENGIVIFILGMLFILSIYHFLLYFQHKDKTYLYYSLYTFTIFISHLNDVKNGFIPILLKPVSETLNFIDLNLIWAYNLLYFVFAFTFIDLKSYSLKWYEIIFKSVYFIFALTLITGILYGLTNNNQFVLKGDLIFVILISILAVIGYIPLFKINNPLKYYIIIGSFFLFIFSLTATLINILKLVSTDNEIAYSIFYIGLIIENILFSLGLGHKQKLVLQDKNDSQKSLIKQLKENEKLKNKVQQQLEQNVIILSKQAKTERLKKLKEKYNKELAELKISSLRSQMNPHFIFNSLNAIKLYIIDNKKENAVYYLNKFSKLIRKILASTREKEITLSDEIDTLKLYLEIENIRFNNEIKFYLTIDKNLNINTIKIPSLILQPFLENAIWHGLSSKKGAKKIIVSFKKDKGSFLKISIIDNGIGRKKSAELKRNKIHKKESIGIQLTEERLNNFCKDFKNNYSLDFIDLFNKNKTSLGTKVTLRIPLK